MKTGANTKRNHTNNFTRGPLLSDEQWVALHVPRFKQVQARYAEYEKFLEAVLKEACKQLAPLAIVNARAKTLPSFAEKILRKRRIYTDSKDPLPPDPLLRMTDLCGGRVITHTARDVERVCEFIKKTFEIDWANSEDTSQRLKPTEFGYRSVHFIVIADSRKLEASGISIPVPSAIKGLKAEIQVRTLLEHASADIGHDTLYKANMNVPNRIRRQFASLAAVLESADREFGRLLTSLKDYSANSGSWHQPDEVQYEIDRLRIVLKFDPHNEPLAVKIGQLALEIGEHQTAWNILEPFLEKGHQAVQRVCGLAKTELNWGGPASNEFSEGLQLLDSSCRHSQPDAETLCALAECWAHRGDDERAGSYFRKAILVDHSEPLSFCRFLEFEIARQRNDAMINLTEPMIRRAMERCRSEIEAGVNLPNAWSCLAIFQLLLREPYAALECLARTLSLCGKPVTAKVSASSEPCAAGRSLRRMRDTVRHLHCIRERIAGFDWFERALTLGLAVAVKDEAAKQELSKLASWTNGKPHFSPEDSVVIISGACAAEMEQVVAAFAPHLVRAVEGLPIVLISGGTRMGVSGLAGRAAARSGGRVKAFGYLPHRLPLGIQADKARFEALFTSNATDFTPLDPLQAWTDLVAAGIDPKRVRIISFAGGRISRVEYAMGLALGARVAVIEDELIPPARRFKDPLFESHPKLIRLPLDGMTLRAFIQMEMTPLTEDDLRRWERAARMAHEDYVKGATPKDPSLRDWENLPESLRLSNYQQVAYWRGVLHGMGLGVRQVSAKDAKNPPLSIARTVGEKGILRLAEMEHGRWNVERLSYGWRYAEDKDVTRKLSPYLIPWKRVPKAIQKYDIDAVRNLPRKLREAGFELYKL